MLRRLVPTLIFLVGLNTVAFAQMTSTPGPGGIPLAPGAPVSGYTPGGIGPGGIDIAPGPAARDIAISRPVPGGRIVTGGFHH
jgi:hypothetical protein